MDHHRDVDAVGMCGTDVSDDSDRDDAVVCDDDDGGGVAVDGDGDCDVFW